jgi:hypothetical protein
MGELAVIFSAAELACCKCSNATFKICCLEEGGQGRKRREEREARDTSPVLRSRSAPLHGPPCKGKKAHAPTTVAASTTNRRTERCIVLERVIYAGMQGKTKIRSLLFHEQDDAKNLSGWKVIEGIE